MVQSNRWAAWGLSAVACRQRTPRGPAGGIAVQQNLAELVERAGTIIRGRVVSARVEPHPELTHLHTVVVTVRVEETLKGQPGDTFTFRQYIWDIRDRYDAAGYKKAQDVLLFLTRPSKAGLSSPVGLQQGRFRILRDQQKREMVVNGVGNHGLFRDLRPTLEAQGISLTEEQGSLIDRHRGGPLSLQEFKKLIRSIAKTN